MVRWIERVIMKHIFIYANKHKKQTELVAKRIQAYLEKEGIICTICMVDVYGRKSLPASMKNGVVVPKDAECVLVLGGDGTMLQAARDTMESHIPLVGVNMGTLGFMTEIEESGLEEALQKIVTKNYTLESRMMLKGQIQEGKKQEIEGLALNDIVLSRTGPMQIIRFKIYVNGKFLNTYLADGMIVTTPTGSTGYNLSAGGPIVEPLANLIMLTPICPHTLNQRSIILSPEDKITIEIPEDKDGKEQSVEVNFDGSHTIQLHEGDRIEIEKASQSITIMKLSQLSFLEVLHRKMSES